MHVTVLNLTVHYEDGPWDPDACDDRGFAVIRLGRHEVARIKLDYFNPYDGAAAALESAAAEWLKGLSDVRH